jgi:hypothetical protein
MPTGSKRGDFKVTGGEAPGQQQAGGRSVKGQCRTEIHEQVASLLGGPGLGRMSRDTQLGAANRTEAVTRAPQLSLIP